MNNIVGQPQTGFQLSTFNSQLSTVLLVAAAPREAADLLPGIRFLSEKKICAWTLRYGMLNGHSVAFLLTGVGMVRATAALSAVLATEPFLGVLQFGVGGAYPHSGLEIGDVVLVDSECDPQSGIVTSEGFRDLGGLGFSLTGEFPNRLCLKNPWSEELAAKLPNAIRAGVATVGTCSGTDEAAWEMERRSGAKVEAMEGFAAAWVAAEHRVPFAELRVISNTTGDRGKQKWDLPGACKVLAEAVQLIFHLNKSLN